MAIDTINIGTSPNDGTGDPLRTAFDKTNDNFLTITTDGGNEITVDNPVTLTPTDLNTALADLVSGGTTPNLEQVLTEGNVSTIPIIFEDSSLQAEIGSYVGFPYIKMLTLGNGEITYFDNSDNTAARLAKFQNKDGTVAYLDDITGVSDGDKGDITVSSSGSVWTIDNGAVTLAKTSGVQGTLTFDTIPTNGSTNPVESNGVFDALALKQDLLGYTPYKFIQTSQTATTGTTAETLVATATINGGTFNTSDVMKVLFGINKTGTAGTYTLRLRVNTTNTLAGATQVALFTSAGTSAQMSIMNRSFSLNGGNLYGYSFSGNALTDVASIGGALSSTAYNTANTLYFFWTVQLANAGDSIIPNLTNLTN